MKKTFAQRILESMSLHDECLPSQPIVEIFGNERVLIENHDGVSEYGPECIQVQTKKGWINIYGNDLQLCRMMGDQLVITGKINQVQLQKGCAI